ncbi:Zn-ribbon domain-containing OB-fold protein [Dactylosporangium sp. CA-092794]|uniref:Zn-ribbon domain-containing OB-fold protein n=1 Tax=Dactylosporangium sp. CA-092794 TaxID=3239929 RepID=UPI003D921B1B
MDTAIGRPVPRPTRLTKPFWDACRERRLLVQRCAACTGYVFLPQAFCSHCQSTDLAWVESSGRGAIVTFTVVWRPQTPAFDAPYVVAAVRLDEGHEMLTNIVGAGPEEIRFGAPVRVSFMDVSPEITLPCFELDR